MASVTAPQRADVEHRAAELAEDLGASLGLPLVLRAGPTPNAYRIESRDATLDEILALLERASRSTQLRRAAGGQR